MFERWRTGSNPAEPIEVMLNRPSRTRWSSEKQFTTIARSQTTFRFILPSHRIVRHVAIAVPPAAIEAVAITDQSCMRLAYFRGKHLDCYVAGQFLWSVIPLPGDKAMDTTELGNHGVTVEIECNGYAPEAADMVYSADLMLNV